MKKNVIRLHEPNRLIRSVQSRYYQPEHFSNKHFVKRRLIKSSAVPVRQPSYWNSCICTRADTSSRADKPIFGMRELCGVVCIPPLLLFLLFLQPTVGGDWSIIIIMIIIVTRSFLANFRRSRAPSALDVKFFN